MSNKKYNICMISDFFYPGLGGVESHIYALSTCLLKRGHKVIVLTRNVENESKQSNRVGIRYMSNGLKAYYLPFYPLATPSGTTTAPSVIGMIPIYRNIFLRERIDIVHGHQCTSTMCVEGILHARTMGLKCCFTDHSLFGFSDAAGIHINKVIKFMLADVDHVISVSHTSKENIVLRSFINPVKVSVVPNAVDAAMFEPRIMEQAKRKQWSLYRYHHSHSPSSPFWPHYNYQQQQHNQQFHHNQQQQLYLNQQQQQQPQQQQQMQLHLNRQQLQLQNLPHPAIPDDGTLQSTNILPRLEIPVPTITVSATIHTNSVEDEVVSQSQQLSLQQPDDVCSVVSSISTDSSLLAEPSTPRPDETHQFQAIEFYYQSTDHLDELDEAFSPHNSNHSLPVDPFGEPQQQHQAPFVLDRQPNKNLKQITIVTVTRLANRKGADLLCAIVPIICKKFAHVNFIIAGDGPKRTELEEMREKHGLFDRVEMLGLIEHKDVRNVLVRGHIFLNCSLTEAFCIAIIEAASCGLYVVSTRVGGVPEVLPSDMASLAEPNPESMCQALGDAITTHVFAIDPIRHHERIKHMYSWTRVAERTEIVYDRVMANKHRTLLERLENFHSAGLIYGKIVCLLVVLNFFFFLVCEWLFPREEIDEAIDLTQVGIRYTNQHQQTHRNK